MVATADATHGAVGTNKDGTEQQREARIVLWNAESTTSTAVIEVRACAIDECHYFCYSLSYYAVG